MPVFTEALSSIERPRRAAGQAVVSRNPKRGLAQPSHGRTAVAIESKGETPMKQRINHAVAALFLVLVAAPLFAVQRNAVDEVIRMTRAGVAEDTILDYLEKTD